MKKALLGAAGVFTLGTVAFSGIAQAQCWWNGAATVCASPQAYPQTYQYPAYYRYPYSYYGYGYKPAWLPSYPGPKPSGGAGH